MATNNYFGFSHGGTQYRNPVKTESKEWEWILPNTKRHNLRGVGKHKQNTKASFSSLFPVKIPHPGMSCNPSIRDYKDLQEIMANKKMCIIKEQKHLERVTTGMFQKIPEDERDENWLNEMSGMEISDELTDNHSPGSEYKSVNSPKKNLKKTIKQKRKKKEQKQLELQRKKLKVEKKKQTDLHQLKFLKEKLDSREKKLAMKNEKRNKLKFKIKQTKRLGTFFNKNFI